MDAHAHPSSLELWNIMWTFVHTKHVLYESNQPHQWHSPFLLRVFWVPGFSHNTTFNFTFPSLCRFSNLLFFPLDLWLVLEKKNVNVRTCLILRVQIIYSLVLVWQECNFHTSCPMMLFLVWCHIGDKSTPLKLNYEQCGARMWVRLSGARSHTARSPNYVALPDKIWQG